MGRTDDHPARFGRVGVPETHDVNQVGPEEASSLSSSPGRQHQLRRHRTPVTADTIVVVGIVSVAIRRVVVTFLEPFLLAGFQRGTDPAPLRVGRRRRKKLQLLLRPNLLLDLRARWKGSVYVPRQAQAAVHRTGQVDPHVPVVLVRPRRLRLLLQVYSRARFFSVVIFVVLSLVVVFLIPEVSIWRVFPAFCLLLVVDVVPSVTIDF